MTTYTMYAYNPIPIKTEGGVAVGEALAVNQTLQTLR